MNVRPNRSWFVPVLGWTLVWTQGAHAQGAAEVPPPPPVAPESEPPASAPAAAPAAATGSVATFPDAEAGSESAPAAESAPTEPVATEPVATEPVVTEPAPSSPPPPPVAPLPPATQEPAPKTELPAEATPPPSKPKSDPKIVHLYVGGGGVFALGTTSSHEWASNCPSLSYAGETLNAECTIQSPIGGALEGQLGIRGKYVGLEGFLFGAADYSYARLNFGEDLVLPKFGDGTQIGRAGAGAGASIRGFYDEGKVGVSGALGVGLLGRGIFTNLNVADGSFEQYFASMIRFDVEVVLLKFFQVGLYGWVEFAPDVTIRPDLSDLNIPPEVEAMLGDITVFQGTQVFLGPYLGFRTP